MTRPTVPDFLRAVLLPAGEDAVAWVAVFDDPPASPGARWGGHSCPPDRAPHINGSNAYVSIAAFPSDAERRNKDSALGAAVVLCDDVTTKGDETRVLRLFGDPSYKIQTSPLSQQWGYLLSELADDDEIRPVHERLNELKLCDKSGMNLVRYGRLPTGINNKPEHGEPFRVECVEWRPDRRFSLAKIAEALASDEDREPDVSPSDGNGIEELAAAIMAGDSYHEPLTRLAAKYAARGYAAGDIITMLKGHMLSSPDRTARWQERFDDIERTVRTAAKFRPADRGDTIVMRDGSLPEAVGSVLDVLARRGIAASIFARGQLLVRPYMAERRGFGDALVSSLEMALLDGTALAYELGGLIAFSRLDQKGRTKPIDCPGVVARTVLAAPHEWAGLPRLDAVVSAPIYLGGGRLLSEPGYHPELRAWLTVPAGVTCLPRPTREDAEASLGRLRGWVEEFPFAGDVDLAVMVAGMMTAALRPSLRTAPGIAFDAPEYGTGKTTAAKAVHVIGFGRLPAVMQFITDAQELRKQIDAAQIEGRQSLVFDNVPSGVIVTNDALAQVLTEPERQARELGASRTHVVPCNQLVMVTGNNVAVGEDLTRRFIACRLDPAGDPTARTFKRPELLADLKAARVEVLTDIFTVVAAYEAAAEPGSAPEPLVGYEEWCRWVQRPLVWLGCADPVLSLRTLQAEDPERAVLDAVVSLWADVYGHDWIGVRKLAAPDNAARDREALHELIALLTEEFGQRGGDIDRKKLGQWLLRMKDRWTTAGLRIERKAAGGKSKKAAQWRVAPRMGGSGGSRGFSPGLNFRENGEARKSVEPSPGDNPPEPSEPPTREYPRYDSDEL